MIDDLGYSRQVIQKAVEYNDFDTFAKRIADKKNWGGWPKDRFERRKEFLDNAAKSKVNTNGKAANVSVPNIKGTLE